jgi:hypothetical protein
MQLGPKIALWTGIGLVVLGSAIPSKMMFQLGLANFALITLGLGCIIGALIAWKLRF